MERVNKVGHCLAITLVTFFLLTVSQAQGAAVNFPGGWLCNGNIAITYVDADNDYSTGVQVGSTWYPNETQLALYHIKGDIDLGGDGIFFSFIGTNCGETNWQTQRGKFVIRFIDALAPGWVWNNQSTWQEKKIQKADFRWSHDWCSNYNEYYGINDPRNVWNPIPYFKATAYEHWSAGGAVVDSTTTSGLQTLEGTAGFSEIYFATDFCENTVRDLQVFASSGGGCPPVGSLDYCRDCGPCAAGEGDCDTDSECQSGLTCNQVPGTDTCQPSGGCPPVGSLDYCRDCGPCAAGEGDCDTNSECQSGLSCNQVPGVDTCQPSGGCPPVGSLDYCRDCGPCAAGEGDCDTNSECQSGLTCNQVPGVDTCQPAACPHPVGSLDYCRDCGPCGAGQGDCDNNSECLSGLTCVQIPGVDTCQ